MQAVLRIFRLISVICRLLSLFCSLNRSVAIFTINYLCLVIIGMTLDMCQLLTPNAHIGLCGFEESLDKNRNEKMVKEK